MHLKGFKDTLIFRQSEFNALESNFMVIILLNTALIKMYRNYLRVIAV